MDTGPAHVPLQLGVEDAVQHDAAVVAVVDAVAAQVAPRGVSCKVKVQAVAAHDQRLPELGELSVFDVDD